MRIPEVPLKPQTGREPVGEDDVASAPIRWNDLSPEVLGDALSVVCVVYWPRRRYTPAIQTSVLAMIQPVLAGNVIV